MQMQFTAYLMSRPTGMERQLCGQETVVRSCRARGGQKVDFADYFLLLGGGVRG